MITNFDDYAQYYDLLYQDKNYIEEVEYIEKHIKNNSSEAKSILELGCGTGAHAEYLATMGYMVHGVDMSEPMLVQAESRKEKLTSDIAERLTFSYGDIRTVNINTKYDVVVSLFHVMSYQTSNDDLTAVFQTASKHLKPGGIFLFDFWYGPAVLIQKPETRIKRLENNEIKVTRLAEPVMHVNKNVVDVNYDVFIEQKETGHITQIQEKHEMRYIFLPELMRFLDNKSWLKFNSFSWLSGDELCENSWSGFVVATHK